MLVLLWASECGHTIFLVNPNRSPRRVRVKGAAAYARVLPLDDSLGRLFGISKPAMMEGSQVSSYLRTLYSCHIPVFARFTR